MKLRPRPRLANLAPWLLGPVVAALALDHVVVDWRPDASAITVADAIQMVRIPDRYGQDDRFVAFSPDGSKFAAVVWRGDIERDVNIYSLLVFDVDVALANPQRPLEPVLSVPFHGDGSDQTATPIDQLTFLADNRTVTFLGTLEGEPRQVYAVDTATGEVRALTRHPTPVTEYSVTADGRVRVYAALDTDPADSARARQVNADGYSPYDGALFEEFFPINAVANHLLGREQRKVPGHFVPAEGSVAPIRVVEAGQLRENLPPGVMLGDGFWAPDGSRVLARAPRLGRALDLPEAQEQALQSTDWLEVRLPSREHTRVPVPPGWSPIWWDASAGELVLRRADSLAVMIREGEGWGAAAPFGIVDGFNRRRPVATNGRIAVGIVESPTAPPELAAHDLATGETTVLTDLNPQLRDRRYGEVEQIRFSTTFDSVSTGWLIKPVDFEPGRRYPLVILLANQAERAWDRSYLIDGRHNLSGHAAQPLAGHGFMVLFMGEPPSGRPESSNEIGAVRANVEEAIRTLAESGQVDSLRVGVSGWSRSGWYTDQLLIHSRFPFAAATQIDGGALEYTENMRAYTDEELGRIRTPLLLQVHGLLQFVYAGSMADRMKALGKPVDVLHFPSAPHSTKQPGHRWRSLTTHVDWWRFWLQDIEDPDPAKATQYERWRSLKTGRRARWTDPPHGDGRASSERAPRNRRSGACGRPSTNGGMPGIRMRSAPS